MGEKREEYLYAWQYRCLRLVVHMQPTSDNTSNSIYLADAITFVIKFTGLARGEGLE